ncbi:hypothetical protein I6N96_12780 [Enterococcus sp. BWM-S5]|uniref:DUF5082 domain-containing protein n=1 Tax=Enterococcus larvae TaxID=2794352 RepID=A0ABS4CKY8_9ENTE|nr:hypothetical protein [Enterococcus larvae]MBP1047149.1 hypothetical protein [Enterococcus larvae]
MTDRKMTEEALFEMKKDHESLEQEENTIKKTKKRISNFMEEWQRLNNAEMEILDEVAFLSQGTHSEGHALRSLDEREIVIGQTRSMVDFELDELDHKQKCLRMEIDDLESDIDRQQKAVYEDA